MAVVAVCVVRQQLSSPQLMRRAVNIFYVPALGINGILGLEVYPTGRCTVIDHSNYFVFYSCLSDPGGQIQ